MNARVLALGLLWIGTLAAVFVVGMRWRPADATPSAETRVQAATDRGISTAPGGDTADVEVMQAELEQLRAERSEWQRALMKRMVQRVSSRSGPMDDAAVEVELNRTWEAFREPQPGEPALVYGMDDIWGAVITTYEILRHGEKGIEFLEEMALAWRTAAVADEEEAHRAREREMVYDVLAAANSARALEALLNLRDALPEAERPGIDKFGEHSEHLSKEEIAPYTQRIMAELDAEIRTAPIPNQAAIARVLGILAFRHGDAAALNRLRQPSMLDMDVNWTIGFAREAHTPEANRYIEWIEANHSEERIAREAGAALDEW